MVFFLLEIPNPRIAVGVWVIDNWLCFDVFDLAHNTLDLLGICRDH